MVIINDIHDLIDEPQLSWPAIHHTGLDVKSESHPVCRILPIPGFISCAGVTRRTGCITCRVHVKLMTGLNKNSVAIWYYAQREPGDEGMKSLTHPKENPGKSTGKSL